MTPRPDQMPEEDANEANSAFSHDEGDHEGGSSGEETAANITSAAAGETPRKRKRTKYQKTSCELCKARKVKCDRAEPACSWCARHNRTCVYLERQKPGSRIGFGLELEAKVNRIDALLQALGRRVEDHIAGDHAVPVAESLTPSLGAGHPSSQQYEGLRRQETNGISPAGQVGHTPSTQGRTVYSENYWQQTNDSQDGAQSDRTSVQAILNLSGGGGGNGDTPFNNQASLASQKAAAAASASIATNPDLPPQDMVYTLVDLYFKHCNTWCPILDRKTTFGSFFGSTSLSEADRVLLHAILATTLRFSKDPRLSPELKAHYHAASKQAVQLYAMENVTVDALRAMVILCLDELGTSNGPRGWNMLAIIAQNVRQLELCAENSVYLSAGGEDVPQTGSMRRVVNAPPDTWIEDEGRRRLAWMVYLLDRYATIATPTFDFMLEDGKMRRCLPCSYDLFSKNVPVETRSWDFSVEGSTAFTVNRPENLGSFSYHCEILRILSRVHDFLKSPIDVASSPDMAAWRNTYQTLDRSLDAWLQSLPSEYSKISALCHSDPASRVANWFMLHSAFVTAVVRLHSSAAYPTVRSALFVPSHYAMQRCLSAVKSLGDIAQDVLDANGLDLLGPPFAFSLWVAARLLLVHAATVECALDPRIDFFVDTLQHVGKYWDVANNYAKILARVVRAGRQGDMTFAAMRKSAHDLVTLTSSTRRSGTDPTSTQVTSLNELDYLDVFDFFNYPKLPQASAVASQTNLVSSQAVSMGGEALRNHGMPDPDADWLGYTPAYG